MKAWKHFDLLEFNSKKIHKDNGSVLRIYIEVNLSSPKLLQKYFYIIFSSNLPTRLKLRCLIKWFYSYYTINFGGARGVMVIVAGYGHGDTSSNPGPDWLHFT